MENLIEKATEFGNQCIGFVQDAERSMVAAMEEAGYHFIKLINANGCYQFDGALMAVVDENEDVCGYDVEAVWVFGSCLMVIPKGFCPIEGDVCTLSEEEVNNCRDKLEEVSYIWDVILNPTDTMIALMWTVQEAIQYFQEKEIENTNE